MKQEVKKLPDEHLTVAKAMVLRHRKKKSCNKCYDRGFVGITDDNMILPCGHCVDQEAVFKEWKTYVDERPELKDIYGDSLEDKPEEGAEEKKPVSPKAAEAGKPAWKKS